MIEVGWFSGRKVSGLVSEWRQKLEVFDSWKMFFAAESILLEFGGLKVNQRTEEKTIYRETFEINPALIIHESGRFAEYEITLNTKLYPLGEAANGHYFLAMSQDRQRVLISLIRF